MAGVVSRNTSVIPWSLLALSIALNIMLLLRATLSHESALPPPVVPADETAATEPVAATRTSPCARSASPRRSVTSSSGGEKSRGRP